MPTHSPSDPTPTTEAGRRLDDRALNGGPSDYESVHADILAIEAEARADALREARDAVRALFAPALTGHDAVVGSYYEAVLAILTETER